MVRAPNGLAVTRHFVLGWGLHRQISRLFPLKDAIDAAGLAKTVSTSRPVLDPLLHEGDRGQLMPGRQRDDQIAMNFANAKTCCTLSS